MDQKVKERIVWQVWCELARLLVTEGGLPTNIAARIADGMLIYLEGEIGVEGDGQPEQYEESPF